MFWICMTFALFASVFTAGKEALTSGGLFFLLGTRMLIAGGLLLGYLCLRAPKRALPAKGMLVPMLVTGCINFFFTNVLEFWGLQELPSWKVAFLYNLSPFLSALWSYLLLREKLPLQKCIGLTIGVGGICLLFLHTPLEAGQLSSWWELGWHEVALLCAVAFSQLGWTLMRRLRLQEAGVDPLAANGWGMLLAGTLCLLCSFATEDYHPLPITSWQTAWTSSLYMLIVSNLVAYNLYAWLLRRFSATLLALAGSMTPLFAAAFGVLLLGEKLEGNYLPATLCYAVGLYLFYRNEVDVLLNKKPENLSSG